MLDGMSWFELLTVVLSVGVGILTWVQWSMGQAFVKQPDFDALGKRVDRVEVTMEHMPDGEDFAALSAEVGQLRGSVEAMTAKIDGLAQVAAQTNQNVAMLMENELAEGRERKNGTG